MGWIKVRTARNTRLVKSFRNSINLEDPSRSSKSLINTTSRYSCYQCVLFLSFLLFYIYVFPFFIYHEVEAFHFIGGKLYSDARTFVNYFVRSERIESFFRVSQGWTKFYIILDSCYLSILEIYLIQILELSIKSWFNVTERHYEKQEQWILKKYIFSKAKAIYKVLTNWDLSRR